jgi:hypothetical protein
MVSELSAMNRIGLSDGFTFLNVGGVGMLVGNNVCAATIAD